MRLLSPAGHACRNLCPREYLPVSYLTHGFSCVQNIILSIQAERNRALNTKLRSEIIVQESNTRDNPARENAGPGESRSEAPRNEGTDVFAPRAGPVPPVQNHIPSVAPENVDLEDPNPATTTSNAAATDNGESCWVQLKRKAVSLFKWVLATRLALFFMGCLALTPVLDILSDILTAADFFRDGHVWWGTLTLAIMYSSSRFTVLYLALLPMPDAFNLLCLYVPGLVQKIVGKPATHGPTVPTLSAPEEFGDDGEGGQPPGVHTDQHDVAAESQDDINADVKLLVRSKYTNMVENRLKVSISIAELYAVAKIIGNEHRRTGSRGNALNVCAGLERCRWCTLATKPVDLVDNFAHPDTPTQRIACRHPLCSQTPLKPSGGFSYWAEHAGDRDHAVSIFMLGHHSNLDSLSQACSQLLQHARSVGVMWSW